MLQKCTKMTYVDVLLRDSRVAFGLIVNLLVSDRAGIM